MSDVIIHAPIAEAAATEVAAGFLDYFTEDEYRAETDDRTVPFKAEADDIQRTQKEVIDRLERWAYTSWRTRSYREQFWSDIPLFLTKRIPIVTGSMVITVNDDVMDLTDVTIDEASGEVRWGDWSAPRWARWTSRMLIVVTYDYGFGEVPDAIKTPCIQATESRLQGEEGGSKIPRNVTSYSTERTDFNLGRRGVNKPWPWDPRASDDIRGYWDPRRPRGMMKSV